MPRKTKDERRLDYLDTGAALIDESAQRPMRHGGYALAHVRLSDVAARAGVTKGALYHIWSSQEDYWRDLLGFFAEHHHAMREELLTSVEEAVAPVRGLERLHAYSDALLEAAAGWAPFLTMLGVVPYIEEDEVMALLEADTKHLLERIGLIVTSVAEHTGRRIREDTPPMGLPLALLTAVQGAVLQLRALPGSMPKDIRTEPDQADGPPRTLLGCTFEALFMAYTEPNEDTPA